MVSYIPLFFNQKRSILNGNRQLTGLRIFWFDLNAAGFQGGHQVRPGPDSRKRDRGKTLMYFVLYHMKSQRELGSLGTQICAAKFLVLLLDSSIFRALAQYNLQYLKVHLGIHL